MCSRFRGSTPWEGGGLGGQSVELFGRSKALVSGLDYQLSFLEHVHEFDTGERPLCGVDRLKPQHRPCHPLDGSMVLFNGMITNDKFCLIRQCQVQLRWSRQLYRFRPRISDYPLDETSHREGSHETPLADTSAIPANSRRGTAMGSGVPVPASMDNTSRTVRCALTISHITDGGDA